MNMKFFALTLSFLGQIFFVSSSFAATAGVTGKIVFKGKAPKVEAVKMSGDPVCLKENQGKTINREDMVVNSNGTLANVFVYVKEGVKKDAVPAVPTEPVVFDQRGCNYTPHVFGIRVNQTLKILNSDPTLHNVHSMAKTNSAFNLGMAKQGQSIEKKFTKPEIGVRIKCDVHGWMTGWANVVDHPYFAVSDQTGKFSISGLPPGEYTIEAWHEKLGTQTQKITVKEGASATADFTFDGTGSHKG
jgi:plastocyanin